MDLWLVILGIVGASVVAFLGLALFFLNLEEERLRDGFLKVLNEATSGVFPASSQNIMASMGPCFLSRYGQKMVVVFSTNVALVANRVNSMLDNHWLHGEDGSDLEETLRRLLRGDEDMVLRARALLQVLSDRELSRSLNMGFGSILDATRREEDSV